MHHQRARVATFQNGYEYHQPQTLSEYEGSAAYDANKVKNPLKIKKLDIFEKIITKIIDIVVDKVAIAIPILIKKIFGLNLESLTNYSGYGYDTDIQKLKNSGILGYLPLIILKFADTIGAFTNVLQKNKFVKNTLMPILILLGITGFVIFLIWWMQSGTEESDSNANRYIDKYYSPPYNYGYPYNNNNYAPAKYIPQDKYR